MRPSIPTSHLNELYTLVSSVTSDAEAKLLLTDLLTPNELQALAERWQLVKMLAAGKTQRDIAASLSVSISKVTRGSACLQRSGGGFALFMKRLSKSRRA